MTSRARNSITFNLPHLVLTCWLETDFIETKFRFELIKEQTKDAPDTQPETNLEPLPIEDATIEITQHEIAVDPESPFDTTDLIDISLYENCDIFALIEPSRALSCVYVWLQVLNLSIQRYGGGVANKTSFDLNSEPA